MATTLEILLRAQNRLSGELKKVQLELKSIQGAVAGVGVASTAAGKKVSGLNARLKATGATASKLRTTLLAFGGIALFAGAIRTIAQFEQSMANVRAIMLTVGEGANNAEADFKALSDEARRLGGTTIFSATQAAEGLLFLGRAGFTSQQALDSLEGTLALAAAGGIGLAESADIATNVLAGFGLAAAEAGRVADILAFTAASANTDVLQLGEAMKFVAPIAASLGVPVGDAASAIGILSNAGLKASLAGTGLRKVLIKLASPTTKLRKIMADLGVDMEDVNPSGPGGLAKAMEVLGNTTFGAVEAIALFGDRGAPAALSMANMSKELRELTLETQVMEGAALKMADVMTATLIGSFKLFRSAIEETLIATGDGDKGLVGSLTKIVDAMAGMVRTLNGTQDPLAKNALFFRQLADAAEAAWLMFQAIIGIKILVFLGGLVGGLYKSVVAFAAVDAAGKRLVFTLRGLGAAALGALGPLGWIVGLGLALVSFAQNDAQAAVDALTEVKDAITALDEKVEDFNYGRLKIETTQAKKNLEALKISLAEAQEAIQSASEDDGDLYGEFALIGEIVDVRVEREKAAEAKRLIAIEEAKIKHLEELQRKTKAKELDIARAAEKQLAKLEGTRFQSETSAVIAQRKLKEDQALLGLTVNLRVAKQQQKEGAAILKSELDQKLISIEDFYAKTEALALTSLGAEIAIEQQKVDVILAANADRLKQLESDRVLAVSGDTTAAELKAIEGNFAARREIVKAQNAQALLDDQEVLQAKLDQRAILIAESDSKESIALQTKLEKDTAEKLKAAQEDLVALKDSLDKRLTAIRLQGDLEREEILRRQSTGELSFIQSDRQLVTVNEEEIAALRVVTDTYTELNAEINDPNIALSLEETKQRMLALGREVPPELAKIKASLVDGITQGLLDLAEGTKTAKEAFADLARNFLRQIAKMIAQQIALNIVRGIFGGFSGGGAVNASGGGAINLSSGGSVSGRGTSTSDSIRANLSDGEYVHKTRAVKYYGLNFMEAVNRMELDKPTGLRKFAITRPRRSSFNEGGVVDSGFGGSRADAPPSSLRIINVLDSDSMIEDYLSSAAGEEIFLNMMRRNGSSIKQIIGG